jgi:hypothetical protein
MGLLACWQDVGIRHPRPASVRNRSTTLPRGSRPCCWSSALGLSLAVPFTNQIFQETAAVSKDAAELHHQRGATTAACCHQTIQQARWEQDAAFGDDEITSKQDSSAAGLTTLSNRHQVGDLGQIICGESCLLVLVAGPTVLSLPLTVSVLVLMLLAG